MTNPDYIERSPTPPTSGSDELTITYRLTGNWLSRWNLYMKTAGEPKKADVLRDCLSLLFASASTDITGRPVEIILRRRGESGDYLADVDLIEYLNLPTVKAYRERRQSEGQ